MNRNYEIFEEFEQRLIAEDQTDLRQKFRLLEGLYMQARNLGVLPLQDPLDGIETDIKLARILNNVRSPSS